MTIFYYLIVGILVLLALSSGISKTLLMPQEVEFFGKYGFTDPILIGYGLLQIIGGVLLAVPKTRISGAILVAVTFLISAVVLGLSGNTPMVIVTLIFTGLLGVLIKFNKKFAI